MESDTDTDPFLGPERVDGQERDDNQKARRGPVPRRAVISALLILLFLVNFTQSLSSLPLNRVIERRLCREYYTEHDRSRIGHDGTVPEELCKIDDVQRGLAWIQGAVDTAWIVGGKPATPCIITERAHGICWIADSFEDFVMTIPLGFMAEKYGQRAILWLNLVPRVWMLVWTVVVGYFEHALPTTAIIAAPILSVLGGDCVFNSITYTIASGITDDYVLRATYFGWMGSISYVVALGAPALAAASMTVLIWLPFWICVALLLLAVPAVSLLPDHLGKAETSRYNNDGRLEQAEPLLSPSATAVPKAKDSIMRAILERLRTLRLIIASHPRNLTLMFICFFLSSLASSDTKLLPQYISKRYHWTFASAGYLLSCKAVVNFVLLTVVIPSLLRSRHSSVGASQGNSDTDRANSRYALTCWFISVLGAFAIAVSTDIWILFPSLLIYALGSALPIFTLSLLKSPAIAPKHDGDLAGSIDPETHIFSLVVMVKTLGSLLGAPLMAALWVHGINTGDAALGTPFFVSAACYVLAILVFRGVKL
ncbi:MFS general substrate transporter [Apiospora saccharicola]|uniref:MFS general substrate transporter n=1 Tax=Apiospora saccharicola TaxID=335842 RepID=A0ABR1ULX1_9PEZI